MLEILRAECGCLRQVLNKYRYNSTFLPVVQRLKVGDSLIQLAFETGLTEH